MKLYIILIFSFCCQLTSVFSQNKDKDLDEIIMLRNKNKHYQERITTETSKSKEFYNLAVSNTESGKKILSDVKGNGTEDDSKRDMATMLFDKANVYSKKSDSVLLLVNKLKDSLKLNMNRINILSKTVRTSNLDTIIPK